MNNSTDENIVKYNNYKQQFARLNKALNNGFNLEAVFIEYAIMEDRTESILRHAELWDAYIKNRRGREATLDSKIRYIQKRAENKKDLLHRYFSDELLTDILNWKEERNHLVHALLKQQIAPDTLPDYAAEGNNLARKLKNKAGNYRRMVEKKKIDNSK